MKWHSDSWETVRARLEQWHPWFAWHPIRIGEQMFWLQTVERCGAFQRVGMDQEWVWQYREVA